jgi:hypothetical protein
MIIIKNKLMAIEPMVKQVRKRFLRMLRQT